jgi:hypothetical protein
MQCQQQQEEEEEEKKKKQEATHYAIVSSLPLLAPSDAKPCPTAASLQSNTAAYLLCT